MTQQPLISHRAAIRTWPGRSTAVGQRLAALVQATQPLGGCLSITARRQPGDTRLWHLNMSWADDQAMSNWLADTVANLFADLISQHLIMEIDFQAGPGDVAEVELRRAG